MGRPAVRAQAVESAYPALNVPAPPHRNPRVLEGTTTANRCPWPAWTRSSTAQGLRLAWRRDLASLLCVLANRQQDLIPVRVPNPGFRGTQIPSPMDQPSEGVNPTNVDGVFIAVGVRIAARVQRLPPYVVRKFQDLTRGVGPRFRRFAVPGIAFDLVTA